MRSLLSLACTYCYRASDTLLLEHAYNGSGALNTFEILEALSRLSGDFQSSFWDLGSPKHGGGTGDCTTDGTGVAASDR